MVTALCDQGNMISLSDISSVDSVVSNFLLVKLAHKRRESIDEHKHYLSERVGYDVGREFAQADWEIRGYESLIVKRFMHDLGLVPVPVEVARW